MMTLIVSYLLVTHASTNKKCIIVVIVGAIKNVLNRKRLSFNVQNITTYRSYLIQIELIAKDQRTG